MHVKDEKALYDSLFHTMALSHTSPRPRPHAQGGKIWWLNDSLMKWFFTTGHSECYRGRENPPYALGVSSTQVSDFDRSLLCSFISHPWHPCPHPCARGPCKLVPTHTLPLLNSELWLLFPSPPSPLNAFCKSDFKYHLLKKVFILKP